MKIPKKAKIIGHNIAIIEKPYVYLGDTEEMGVASYSENKIYIAKMANNDPVEDSVKKEVVLHECMHFVDDGMDIGLKENQIKKLSRGLITFMRDNKKLIEWLME